MSKNINSQQWSIWTSRIISCHNDLLMRRVYLSKKNRFIQITNNQWKDIFKKNDWRNQMIMNHFSMSLWKTCFRCRTNDHSWCHIRFVLIEKTQFHNWLKTRIFEIRAMWLHYHNSIYASTTIDDKWKIKSRLDRKMWICNFEQKERINSI